MPFLIKPRTLGLMTKAERRPAGASFIVSAFGLFDLAAPDPYRLQGDQAMWLLVAKELPPGAIFDLGMPKPTAEVLLAGHAAALDGEPVQRMGLAWAIGGLQKSLLVTGDRSWRLAGSTAVPTEPEPFVQMPLAPSRCFGGEGHPSNPAGVGFRAQERLVAREVVALPNIETPELAIRAIGDQPAPPRFGPMAVDAKERLQYAGTYDAAWMKTRAPALAEDADPRLFLFAPLDQRLPGYLDGDEGYGLRNFSADSPEIQQHLPGFRVRCFIGWTDPEKPIVELPMRIDTLWLFAGARRGVMVYRGATPVEDFEAADVADVMVCYERLAEEPRPLSHYLQVRALRTDPATAFKYAFAEHQLTPAVPQAELDRKDALRRARAAERKRKSAESMEWSIQQELIRSGIPKAMWPAIEIAESDDDIVMPLPEEIAAGEVDLAELLDAVEALQAKKEAELDALAQKHQPAMDAMRAIASGEAEPDTVDRLLAMLDQPDIAAQLDAEIARLPAAAPAPFEAAAPPGPATAEDALDRARNWRQSILDAATPKVDEAEQLAQARGRFLGLPEGAPMASLRRELTLDLFTLPDLDAAALPAGGEADALTLDEALRALEQNPATPPDAVRQARDALGHADALLARHFPNLAPDGGSALQALSSPRADAAAPAATGSRLTDARAELQTAHADIHANLDTAETQIATGLAALRLVSPQPLKPDVPLTPGVALALGDLVVQQFGAGISLAGRDFAGADLTGRDLSGADLTGAFLENARLDGARLAGASLASATLCGASLRQADFGGCDLTKANLCKVDAEHTSFASARLVDTSFIEARLDGASFFGAEMDDLIFMMTPLAAASFQGARMSSVIFMRCALDDTDWRGALVERTQMVDCSLMRATFTEALLHEVALMKVRMEQADFSDSRLSTVLFAGEVDLRQARFSRAISAGLTFQKADLVGADFGQARLEGLCFIETSLAGANFREASAKRGIFARNILTSTDFFAANLWEAQLNRADLTGASLRAANLLGADLMDATLFGADFSRANLMRTILAVATDDA